MCPFQIIYQIGIIVIYHFGIILSRGDNLNNRLQELRLKNNYTQQKVAMDLCVSQNSISRYETGEREACYDLLIRFADYYHVSIDYLLFRTDKPELNR